MRNSMRLRGPMVCHVLFQAQQVCDVDVAGAGAGAAVVSVSRSVASLRRETRTSVTGTP